MVKRPWLNSEQNADPNYAIFIFFESSQQELFFIIVNLKVFLT